MPTSKLGVVCFFDCVTMFLDCGYTICPDRVFHRIHVFIKVRPPTKINFFGAMPPKIRFTRFVFTLNNPTDATKAFLSDNYKKNFVRFVVTEETGESGTPHLQGAGAVAKQTYLNALQALISPTQKAHIEKQRGDNKQACDYCLKDVDKSPFHLMHGDWAVTAGSRWDTCSDHLVHPYASPFSTGNSCVNPPSPGCLFCRYVQV